jgi:hypothetical protein
MAEHDIVANAIGTAWPMIDSRTRSPPYHCHLSRSTATPISGGATPWMSIVARGWFSPSGTFADTPDIAWHLGCDFSSVIILAQRMGPKHAGYEESCFRAEARGP